LFTPNTLDIIGAGTNPGDRRIRLWAEATTEFTGSGAFAGGLGIGLFNPTLAKLQLNGRGGTAFSMAVMDSAVNAAGAVLFANVNRPNAGLAIRGSSFGASANQNSINFSSNDGNTIHFTVRGDGNVGINNPSPAEKLSLAGNFNITGQILNNGVGGINGQVLTLKSGGTMQWQTPTVVFKDTMTIPIFAFVSNDPNAAMKHFNGSGSNNIGHVPVAGSTALLQAPLILPHNAVVTQIRAYLFDNTNAEQILGLVTEYPISTLGGGTLIAQFGTPTQFAGFQEFNYNTPFTINNASKAYFLRVMPTDGTWPGDASIGFSCFRIAYTYTN
jgi:hypothetical protein